ncbi:hypothetical protein JCM15519_14140 [Fundidesulfovibrio butyratiphilus]
MRTFFLTVFLAAALAAGPTRAEVVQFIGKTSSPQKYEVWSPHATEKEMKLWKEQDKEVKSKQGEDAEAPAKPFEGDMKITRVLVDIGSRVEPEQSLMTYGFPLEDMQAERQKLSKSDISAQESELAKNQAQLDAAQLDLDEYRRRLLEGKSSTEEVREQARLVEVLRLKQRAMQDSINFDKEMLRGELELARAKYGPKASSAGIPGEAKLRSQERGYVLWVNPDLKPGVVLTEKTKLFVLGGMDPLYIRALVHEIKVPRLRVGDKATVTFESLPGQVFHAVISRIQLTADATENQLPSHFEVELTLPNPDLKLKDGLRGQVRVEVPDGPRE